MARVSTLFVFIAAALAVCAVPVPDAADIPFGNIILSSHGEAGSVIDTSGVDKESIPTIQQSLHRRMEAVICGVAPSFCKSAGLRATSS
ncbi:hypothetical protein M422DRAFT_34212 [Sphaerobolus stellatus SS14]|uniref:Unplaced genomic scaffold SPHSTscaffold_102, whole genome shotgun sequence n=1 Tax=Sphaerobolus stellatus (strain SS14) TaxID=990650 RepID=A0A0C9VGL7_SPHS4|nr:hypothetical protein M422DRAFT_34212 [Sphaerobolus stellatus SS14]